MTREVQEEDLLTPEEWQAAQRLAELRLSKTTRAISEVAQAQKENHARQYGLDNNLNQKGADLAEALTRIMLRVRLSDKRLGPADQAPDQWADPKVP